MLISPSSTPMGKTEVSPQALHTRHAATPYLGATLRGKVVATYLRGRVVYEMGRFTDAPFGHEV